MAGVPIYRTAVAAQWIDYNGHLRDAYYGLIVSFAIDALMERIGVDAAYRERTGCTIYTLELHLHFLREIKGDDTVAVGLRVLGADHKRIHAAFELYREPQIEPAATAEAMLLHVQQRGAQVASTAFPPAVAAAIDALRQTSAQLTAGGPGSRQMQLSPR